jgi:hypothetical protein
MNVNTTIHSTGTATELWLTMSAQLDLIEALNTTRDEADAANDSDMVAATNRAIDLALAQLEPMISAYEQYLGTDSLAVALDLGDEVKAVEAELAATRAYLEEARLLVEKAEEIGDNVTALINSVLILIGLAHVEELELTLKEKLGMETEPRDELKEAGIELYLSTLTTLVEKLSDLAAAYDLAMVANDHELADAVEVEVVGVSMEILGVTKAYVASINTTN